MSLIIKSGSSGNLLVVNADGSIGVVLSGSSSSLDVTDRAARLLGHVAVDNFPLVQSIFGVVDVTDRAARLVGHVVVDNLPVVQSVSGAVAVTNFPSSVAVNNFPSTQPVSGTVLVGNFPGTQPVSGSLDVTDRSARLVGHVVVDNFPSVGLGRTNVILSADRVAGRLIEALETLTINVGGVVLTGTFHTVSPGKKLRLTSLMVQFLNAAGTPERVLVRVRSSASVTSSSPNIAMGMATSFLANSSSGGSDNIGFPDGPDISAGQQIGISQLCTVSTAGVVSFLLQGYEY